MRLTVVTLILLLSGSAVALPNDPTDVEIARRHFERGSALYEGGSYAEAIVEFELARAVKPHPMLDYNIARCHDRLEHFDGAVAAYERYLAGTPNAADADEVKTRIATLKARSGLVTRVAVEHVAGKSAPPSAVPAAALTATPPPPLPHRRRVATYAVGGVGVAILAGALGSALAARSNYNELDASCPGGTCNRALVPNAQSLIDNGRTATVASDVLLGVGLTAVATGVVLFFVEGRRMPWKK